MQKNKKTLIPYLLAGTMTVMIYYILQSLAHCPYIYKDGMEAFYGAQIISILLEISGQIVAVFAAVFLFYTNQFMIRARKKEMGLYGILGMSKKNITYILAAESLINALISIVTGIMMGTFLNKLMLLILYKIINQPPVNGLFFSVEALKSTLVLFVILFAVSLIYNVASIRVGKPIALLQSDRTGEKEPKVKVPIFILGIITLTAGYKLALSAKSIGGAVNILFVSILLVVIATYCLFTAGSIFILKCMKKNPKFYYKTKNFISVSNLMFRMKHNAAGLASICVLSTGVILLLTCGFSLMMLIGKNIDDRYPTDIIVTETVSEAGKGMDDFAAINKALQQDGIVTTDQIYRQYRNIMVTEKDGKQKITDPDTFDSDIASDIVTYLLSAADYNEYANTDLKLKDDEILIYSSGKEWKKGDNLNFMGKEYTVAGEADYSAIRYIIDSTMSIFEREILVFPDDEQICALMAEAGQRVNPDEYEVFIGYQLEKALTAEQMETVRALVELGGLNHEAICFKSEEMSVFYTLYGGIFFVGMFLAALFLMATVMIIYYKQMSEGYEDQNRFEIMQKVGLSHREVKSSIRRQILMVFFLPLLMAMLHISMAFPLIRRMLLLFGMTNTRLFIGCTAGTVLIFALVYGLIYLMTAKSYYHIVERR
mgnify:CR=1 FL=1